MKSRLIATMAALALLAGSNAAPAGHEHRWGHGEQRWPAAPTSAWQPARPGTMYERLHGEPRGGQRVQGHSQQYRDQHHHRHSQQYHNPHYRPHSQRLYPHRPYYRQQYWLPLGRHLPLWSHVPGYHGGWIIAPERNWRR